MILFKISFSNHLFISSINPWNTHRSEKAEKPQRNSPRYQFIPLLKNRANPKPQTQIKIE